MGKITTATPEQWDGIEQIRQRWLSEEQTAQYPVQEIREEVWATLARIGQPRVPVWVVDSPFAAVMIANLEANLGDNLRANLEANLGVNLEANLGANLRANLEANLGDNLRANLEANLGDNLRANLEANLRANLRANLEANLGVNLRVYCGVYLNALAGWAEGGDLLGVPRHECYDTFMRWNRLCPVWMWSKSQIFVLKRPTQIHWSDSGLHNSSGPSVYYSSVFSLWNINNIAVDEQIVMRPETQTLKQINSDQNADRRAIRIERFGWPRYLQESHAEVIDSRHNAVENTQETLCAVGTGQKRLLVTCPTGRQFALGVPDDVATCQHAQQWLAGDMAKFNVIGRT